MSGVSSSLCPAVPCAQNKDNCTFNVSNMNVASLAYVKKDLTVGDASNTNERRIQVNAFKGDVHTKNGIRILARPSTNEQVYSEWFISSRNNNLVSSWCTKGMNTPEEEVLTVLTSTSNVGSVGINLKHPEEKLHVNGFMFTKNDLITPTANIGIGIRNPQQRLHVIGNMGVTNFNLYANQLCINTSSCSHRISLQGNIYTEGDIIANNMVITNEATVRGHLKGIVEQVINSRPITSTTNVDPKKITNILVQGQTSSTSDISHIILSGLNRNSYPNVFIKNGYIEADHREILPLHTPGLAIVLDSSSSSLDWRLHIRTILGSSRGRRFFVTLGIIQDA